jgi:hypothetical protein
LGCGPNQRRLNHQLPPARATEESKGCVDRLTHCFPSIPVRMRQIQTQGFLRSQNKPMTLIQSNEDNRSTKRWIPKLNAAQTGVHSSLNRYAFASKYEFRALREICSSPLLSAWRSS